MQLPKETKPKHPVTKTLVTTSLFRGAEDFLPHFPKCQPLQGTSQGPRPREAPGPSAGEQEHNPRDLSVWEVPT